MVFFSCALFHDAMAAVPVEVSVGKGSVLTLKKKSERVSISDPAIADIIMISPAEVLINGKKVGTTSLIVWDKEGNKTFFDVHVITGDIATLIEQIKNIAPDADVTVEMAGDSVVLRGEIKDEETIKKLAAISGAYAPKVINFLRVKEPQQVLLEVKVAQIDKNKLKELGISTLVKGSTAEGTGGLIATPKGTLGGAAGVDMGPSIEGFDLAKVTPEIGVAHFPSGVALFIRALQEKGLAKILAEPNLVVRSGEKGAFLAGSKVPVQQVTGAGATATVSIAFEEVGVKLNFAPEVLEEGRIRLKIDPAEVSNIVRYIEFEGGVVAPEIDTRRVSTSVDLKEGESLVLAGMLSEETKKNLRKIPLFGDIPILGALFRSTKDELDKTELAFFITPRLVKPLPPGQRPELPGAKSPTPEEEREFNWIPVPVPSSGGGEKAQ
ncbi:MAG: pilus assembly protein N-terminal domain-containing protein [Deltaproteobacteria bacterium]|nr:pilus assembly protein N-terminal domain-containing protein [Deltaproteobacteria bacterium]